MTISVKITNESQLYDPHSRSIEVVDGTGATYSVAPEESIFVHVWHGTKITITEKDLETRSLRTLTNILVILYSHAVNKLRA